MAREGRRKRAGEEEKKGGRARGAARREGGLEKSMEGKKEERSGWEERKGGREESGRGRRYLGREGKETPDLSPPSPHRPLPLPLTLSSQLFFLTFIRAGKVRQVELRRLLFFFPRKCTWGGSFHYTLSQCEAMQPMIPPSLTLVYSHSLFIRLILGGVFDNGFLNKPNYAHQPEYLA